MFLFEHLRLGKGSTSISDSGSGSDSGSSDDVCLLPDLPIDPL